MGILGKIFGDPNEKILKNLQPTIDKINALEAEMQKLSDDGLRQKTAEFVVSLKNVKKEDSDKQLEAILPEAFAVVREASRRVLGMRHFDVQLIGGIVLNRGEIAEMKTGEGKTLVATLPLYLNALTKRGVQLVTVNDYLAKVGAGWMARLYHFLGLSVGVIVHESGLLYDPEYNDESQYDERLRHFRPVTRQEAYGADITYGTNNEFGFDYLRDNMVMNLKDMVQRELYFAIVDEIDSILIDEARTPLIISAPAEESTDKYFKFAQLVAKLNEGEDYNVDEKLRAATLTEGGIQRMEQWLGVDNIYTAGGIREVHHIEQALKAHALFKRERDYVVQEGQVIIVDEFTGRLMHGRRYSEGLHQAIEAKEGVKVQRESQTLATITFQNYFRMYKKLAGMTGTAVTEAEEFAKIYNLNTVAIPTNKPNIRRDSNDYIYKNETGKYLAVIKDVKERSEKGQPVLVGTISIEKNELLAGLMEREGLRPNVLNAKNHEKEARFIAEAGKPGTVTIATNMAGRGVDISLGGEPVAPGEDGYEAWLAEHEKVKSLGGLHVIGTERHESRRIDNQLRGRAARQGDPGSSQFFVSAEDDLMRIFGGDRMKSVMTTLKVPDDMPIENSLISRSIESAQKKVEGNNFDIRKHLVEYDDVINKHREAIYGKRRRILEKANGLPGAESDPEKGRSENPEVKDAAAKDLSQMVLEFIEQEIEQVVSFHTAADYAKDWNLAEIFETIATIYPVDDELKKNIFKFQEGDTPKLEKAQARTEIIEYLKKITQEKYEKMKIAAQDSGIDWRQIEKAVLIRSIDTLWVEHLDAMASVRQGIGLRGYGQRDPLIEYKKEAYSLFNELNALIQKEVVYSIFKIGAAQQAMRDGISAPSLIDRARNFSAPAKTSNSSSSAFAAYKQSAQNQSGLTTSFAEPKQKTKDEEGNKVGRNDLCPCGSGKKYKKCHGA